MKLTRKQLRRLIAEAINETKRYISSPDGSKLTPADRAFRSAEEKDIYAADVHPKIAKLVQGLDIESRVQGRELAHAIADEDSPLVQFGELTPEEETAIDYMGHARSIEQDPLGAGLEYPIDKEALYSAMKSKSTRLLKHFGFQYIKDIPHLSIETGEAGYDDVHEMLRFQARALGCDVYDLAFVDDEREESLKAYDAILDFMSEMDMSKKSYVPIAEDKGYFGSNEMYDLDGLRVLFTNHMGGYHTATICGK